MFFVKFKVSFSILLFLGLIVCSAQVQASDKFVKMDKDTNHSISWDEFKAQYPQMRKGAFDSIDTNKNSDISKDEWKLFQDSHSMDRANSPDKMKMTNDDVRHNGKPRIFMNAPVN